MLLLYIEIYSENGGMISATIDIEATEENLNNGYKTAIKRISRSNLTIGGSVRK